MKNILIFAGVILLCVLILSAWFFIGNLGNFAQFLGKESTDIFANEKSRFIGSWKTTKDYSSLLYTYQFSNDDTILTLTNADNLEDIFILMRIHEID